MNIQDDNLIIKELKKNKWRNERRKGKDKTRNMEGKKVENQCTLWIIAVNYREEHEYCNAFVISYVGVKCLTRHWSVLRDTLTRVPRRENHEDIEDSISHLSSMNILVEVSSNNTYLSLSCFSDAESNSLFAPPSQQTFNTAIIKSKEKK